MTTPTRLLLGVVAIVATILSLLLAERVGGPLARYIFGPPVGFREDFTSHAAFRQAFLVQAVFVGLAFFALGSAVARWNLINLSYKHSVLVANPITVGVGFAAYKMAYHALSFPDRLAEYDSPAIFLLFCVASPVVFALCVYAGAHVRRSCTVAG